MKAHTLFIILGLLIALTACSSAPQLYRMQNCKPAGSVDGVAQFDCEKADLPHNIKSVK